VTADTYEYPPAFWMLNGRWVFVIRPERGSSKVRLTSFSVEGLACRNDVDLDPSDLLPYDADHMRRWRGTVTC
jgi:hypothetical protein